jgi:hypothetical protein
LVPPGQGGKVIILQQRTEARECFIFGAAEPGIKGIFFVF